MVVCRQFALALLVCGPAILISPGFAGSGDNAARAPRLLLAQTAAAPEAEEATEPDSGAEDAAAVAFTEDFLNDPAHHAAGKELWEGTCQHCHGSKAYPGKAPKLRPGKYTPEFVYDRVTNGFRKMPAWKDILSDEERKNVVAYVLSKKFSP